ncbi:hypothetical protein [Streptomyces sp. NBC_00847]|uniref:hypothetical protein n=1 Tax=Streptomyces sp. NBC_00847 TaxID=2975850 RepID=UPI0022516972|nr:hypothetical protein [Streptomyces sp. NBC_00847]MCX4884820.1 hypothetical protein [Streptomyces sp. NBC_00847]
MSSRTGLRTVTTPAAATRENTPFTTATQTPIMVREDWAPKYAESRSVRNSPSSMASSSARAAPSRNCSVASLSTFGSSRPVPAVDKQARTVPTTAMMQPTIRAGSAACSRETLSPSMSRAWITWLVTSSPAAWVMLWPTSPIPMANRARRSACQARRRVLPTSAGTIRAACPNLVSSRAYSWRTQPKS